ncbi:helicase-exonuclease AddAB subunit AddA [Alkalicoccus chagannorensis]|uniref:helicase-exonuclease AddAB subunit AddA n=1 Tax=Alkalicoccus chagannorensis TaxID=427072 RepID=UPI0003FA38F7|nr:helicase-exonuclease AddAB subunit AddA [Alkalicoccus chagannorensis]
MNKPEGSRWTDAQWQAAAEESRPLLVSAAAGSGKTAVLVERIIRKLLDPDVRADLQELLVVTFTNAAASEMKQRIGKAVEEALRREPESEHLRRQLSQVQRAPISTLHSFCMKVIRRNYFELGLDPSFRLLDETEASLIQEEVIEEVFESRYESGDMSFLQLADYFTGDQKDDERLKDMVLRVHRFSRSQPSPSLWLDHMAAVYHAASERPFDELSWVAQGLHYVHVELEQAVSGLKQAEEAAEAPGGPAAYAAALQSEIGELELALQSAGWEETKKSVNGLAFKRLPPVKKGDDVDEARKKEVKDLRDKVKKQIESLQKSFFSQTPESIVQEMTLMAPVLDTLADVTKAFDEQFREAKEERTALDFSDLEHYCLQVLQGENGPSREAERYQQQLQEVLVDEYQDINEVQEAILQLLSGGKIMFMVGDVKQSIYRFRQADPTLFLRKYEQYRHGEGGTRIDLSENFRSRGEVLAAVNEIFYPLMTKSFGELDYDEAASLKEGVQQFPDMPDQPEVLLIDQKESSMETAETEAHAAASRIKSMIEEGRLVYDKEARQMRPVAYQDIVILHRSMTWAETYTEVLRMYDIPVHADLRGGYFDAVDIRVMLSLLQIMDNPYQDIPLAAVLRSPIFGFGENDLARIRLYRREGRFYEALQEAAGAEPDTFGPVIDRLIEWRQEASVRPLASYIWYLYEESGYYEFAGGLPEGRQRQADLHALIDRAKAYEATSFRGLFRFLRFIDRLKERGEDLGRARAVGSQENVVRLMTVHKSKGLEFPVVLSAGAAREFNTQELSNPFLMHRDGGIASRWVDLQQRVSYETVYYHTLQEQIRREMLAEEMRVLYVALTRAEQQLIVLGTVKGREEAYKKWTADPPALPLPETGRRRADSPLDWIMRSLLNSYETRKKDLDQPFSAGSWLVQWTEPQSRLSGSQKQEYAQIRRVMNKQPVEAPITAFPLTSSYVHQSASTTYVKQTVSELKRKKETEDPYAAVRYRESSYPRPEFMQETAAAGAEIGTMFHAVMERFDWTRWGKEEVDQQLKDMTIKGFLKSSEAAQLPASWFYTFDHSELAASLRRADKVERELPFYLEVPASRFNPDWNGPEEEMFVQGIIDVVYEDEEGIHIVDYKTDRVSENELESLVSRYAFQLDMYRRALAEARDLDPGTITTEIYAVRSGQTILVPPEEEPGGRHKAP